MFAMSAIGGCASSPQYLYNIDDAANLASHSTFGFFDEREPGMAAYQSVAHRHLKSAIVREMLARGYRRSEQPELLVNIHLQRRDDDDALGTLNIGVTDPASSALLWEGIAVGSVSQRMYESLEATIDAVVAKLFERFPKQSPSQAPTQTST